MNLPATNMIPDKLINAKIYLDGQSELLGVGDAELPALEYITESISGLGLAGEMESPVIGHFKSMPFKFKFHTLNASALVLLKPETHHLEIRASIQELDGGTGKLVPVACKVLLHGLPKKVGLGKLEPGKKMDSEVELECTYMKIWLGGTEAIEIDKLNFVARVNGHSMLGEVRSHLGMD